MVSVIYSLFRAAKIKVIPVTKQLFVVEKWHGMVFLLLVIPILNKCSAFYFILVKVCVHLSFSESLSILRSVSSLGIEAN